MSGTRAGYLKTRQTLIAKYGSEEALMEHLKSIASKGGSKKGVAKGFALMTPEQRAAHGRKGGKISRRTGKKNERNTN